MQGLRAISPIIPPHVVLQRIPGGQKALYLGPKHRTTMLAYYAERTMPYAPTSATAELYMPPPSILQYMPTADFTGPGQHLGQQGPILGNSRAAPSEGVLAQ
jgi:hypothetical protein